MKTYYLCDIIWEDGMDVFDWIVKVYRRYDLLHLRLSGHWFKLYVSEERMKEIDDYDRNSRELYFSHSRLDLFLYLRSISVLIVDDGHEKLEIIKRSK